MRRTAIAVATVLLAVAPLAGCSKSQDEIAAECEKAIDSTSTTTNRPDECDGLSDENYKLLLAHWILEQQGAFGSATP